MNEYLATMVARSEHQYINHSLAPVRDFDGHRSLYQPARMAKYIGGFTQWIGTTLNAVRDAVHDNTRQEQRLPQTAPQTDNC